MSCVGVVASKGGVEAVRETTSQSSYVNRRLIPRVSSNYLQWCGPRRDRSPFATCSLVVKRRKLLSMFKLLLSLFLKDIFDNV
jgi:hypothetical protein